MSKDRADAVFVNDDLHPVSFLCKHFNNQLFVFRTPFLHFPVGINDRPDVVDDFLHLSTLVMQGNALERERIEDSVDAGFGPACDAYPQILKA
jgi:hypothetical protein